MKRLKLSEYTFLILLLGGLTGIGNVCAEDTGKQSPLPSFAVEGVTVEAKRPDWETQLSPGTVTVIRPEDYKGEQKSLPDLLKQVPGVHVREVNGKGQYTTVTIRGSTAAQVGVFVDGVLTNLGGDAAVDISAIPVKNVERIEVYRGYIPARFGGTFMGGVINVVTKKPSRIGVSAELGKTSLGGESLSTEVTAPLGGGTLLMGINYEDSDGDFRYRNYAAPRAEGKVLQDLNASQSMIANYYLKQIDVITGREQGSNPDSLKAALSDEQVSYFKNHTDEWIAYRDSGGLRSNILDGLSASFLSWTEKPYATYQDLKNVIPLMERMYGKEFHQTASKYGKDYIPGGTEMDNMSYWGYLVDEWNNFLGGDGGVLYDEKGKDTGIKQKIIDAYKKEKLGGDIEKKVEEFLKPYSAENDKASLSDHQKQVDKAKKYLKAIRDNRRYRRYNDYKNTNFLAKWQNDAWMAKLSVSRVDRHLPDTLWGDSANDAIDTGYPTDLWDHYYAESRRQKMTTTEALLQNRHHHGRLEWGWRADYSHQDKKYVAEHKLDWTPHVGNTDRNFRWNNTPLREWSRYKSNKYNFQLDGSYQLSDRQMLDFQANYSWEKLRVDGSLMHETLEGKIGSQLQMMRNKYEQSIFNFQLQDSITLDKKGSWVLTPAVRYNQSQIVGYSDGKRFGGKQHFTWIHEKDSQTDGKWTWQMALKKEFSDRLTLRATGGTYYRLLNMYEIAGDGAGILPAPRDAYESIFPLPEEGKQFDCSLLWNGRLLGAENKTTVTYFWRDSVNMLQLWRAGLDYWVYYNDIKGKAHGWELSTNFKWKKWELDVKATETIVSVQKRNSSVNYAYTDCLSTFQPRWESNIRLLFHPNARWSIFGEMHYTDDYFTYYGKFSDTDSHVTYLGGKPVGNLTVYNAGVKLQPSPAWQLTFGCNDIFDKGPRQKVSSSTFSFGTGYINPEFPLQGRTYYATFKYIF